MIIKDKDQLVSYEELLTTQMLQIEAIARNSEMHLQSIINSYRASGGISATALSLGIGIRL
jgi:hypothetical protein